MPCPTRLRPCWTRWRSSPFSSSGTWISGIWPFSIPTARNFWLAWGENTPCKPCSAWDQSAAIPLSCHFSSRRSAILPTKALISLMSAWRLDIKRPGKLWKTIKKKSPKPRKRTASCCRPLATSSSMIRSPMSACAKPSITTFRATPSKPLYRRPAR